MELRKIFGESGKVYFVTYSPETYWKAFTETSGVQGFQVSRHPVYGAISARRGGADGNGSMPLTSVVRSACHAS